MTEKFLSQDEIDSLLKMNSELNSEGKLDSTAKDILGEVGNISMSNAATALSQLLGEPVTITTPRVELTTIDKLNKTFDVPYVLLQSRFDEGFMGASALMMRTEDASVIAGILMKKPQNTPMEEFSEIELSAISEVMNQMIGSASTALSTMFSKRVNITPPTTSVISKDNQVFINGFFDEEVVKISFRLTVDGLVDSEIMQLYSVETSQQIIDEMINPLNEETKKTDDVPEEVIYFEEAEEQSFEVKKPKFNKLMEKEKIRGKNNIDMILDVPLELSVILGRSKRSIKEILSLEPGSIVELNEVVEEPLDIYVNGKKIAKGEVVVVDEKFGIRITQILSPKDRVKKLR